jgi:drug/metabolite transporter (DMT)-like permease
MPPQTIPPVAYPLLAATLFGVSTPLAKLLGTGIHPVLLSSLLYLGMGASMALVFIVTRRRGREVAEARLRRKDIPWLLGTMLAGGFLAPNLLMAGLSVTPATTASLLLNFEAVATTLIAWGIFHEHVGRRVAVAVLLITMAAIALTLDLSGVYGLSWGALAIVASCAIWGLDNNFTRVISLRDPAAIATFKGLAAGSISLLAALALHVPVPAPAQAAGALVLGFCCFGLSSFFFILSLRSMGASRTGAYFGAAPFVGVGASVLIFWEAPDLQFLAALPLMIAGAWLLVSEQHGHAHVHERLVHEHRHRHDDGHHFHDHGDDRVGGHTHVHVHEPMEHDHPHSPDIHHRH